MADCNCHAHGSFLTAKGLEEAAQRFSLEGLDSRGVAGEVDRVGSVSALVEVEDDFEYDALHTELNDLVEVGDPQRSFCF